MVTSILQSTNLATRLLLELCALVAISYWGFHLDGPTALRVAVGLGAPVVTALVWGAFASPNAAVALSGPAKVTVQLLLFAAATVALVAADRQPLAAVFAAFASINGALMAHWSQ